MKPKLLITMGCSMTEGVGCYDLNNMGGYSQYNKMPQPYYGIQFKNFHKLGWPNKLGRKLGYDKVINLGQAGSSTSGQLKIFYENISTNFFEDYDVLVFWLLTEPSRFSFYINGKIKGYTLSNSELNEMELAYISELKDINFDPLLEQIFYVKIMEEICENRNWGLLTTHWDMYVGKFYKKLYKTKTHLTEETYDILSEDINHKSPFCGHPNELGYEHISQAFYDKIKLNHPQYINPNPNQNELDWIHMGNPIKHKKGLI